LDDDSSAEGNDQLNNIIKQAITHCNSSTWIPDTDNLEPELARCVRAQNNIGWGQQIIRGRITKQLEKFMDNHYKANGSSDQKHTGARWAKSLIKAIWDNMEPTQCGNIWEPDHVKAGNTTTETTHQGQRLLYIQRCSEHPGQIKTVYQRLCRTAT
jgi:hypothetical protein